MTIPGFIINTSELQDHIHLGYANRDGSSPTGFDSYGAPPYRFLARRRVPRYEVPAAFIRSWDGTPHDHVLMDGTTKQAKVFKDFIYDVRVTLLELDVLEALLKNRVYFIDNRHCASSSNHADYVKLMYFDALDYGEHYDPVLTMNIVTIVLKDMNTVAPE